MRPVDRHFVHAYYGMKSVSTDGTAVVHTSMCNTDGIPVSTATHLQDDRVLDSLVVVQKPRQVVRVVGDGGRRHHFRPKDRTLRQEAQQEAHMPVGVLHHRSQREHLHVTSAVESEFECAPEGSMIEDDKQQ